MYYVEHRPSLQRSTAPKMVPEEILDTCHGFRGVYAWLPLHAEEITRQGHMRDLDEYPVASNILFLDFDNNEQAAAGFRQLLDQQGIAYEEYDSGNRSVHFHVSIVGMYGVDVPQRQKLWVKKNAPGADTSFYHKSGIYRLPGTFHVKNPGHFKRLVNHRSGRRLHVVVPDEEVRASIPSGEDSTELDFVLQRLLWAQIGEGDRTPHMYKIMKTAQRVGLSFDEALSELQYWNAERCAAPHDPEYVEKWATRLRW